MDLAGTTISATAATFSSALRRGPVAVVFVAPAWDRLSSRLLGSLAGLPAEYLHVDVSSSEEAAELAVSLGCPARLPAVVHYEAQGERVAAWVQDVLPNEIHILEAVKGTESLLLSSASIIEWPRERAESLLCNEPAAEVLSGESTGPILAASGGRCVRIFVAGDKSHCGKTTICLGILGALLRSGVPASRLGYIKPVRPS